jgi:hypothetical protein
MALSAILLQKICASISVMAMVNAILGGVIAMKVGLGKIVPTEH